MMTTGPKNAAELQGAIKSVVAEAIWNGVSREAIAAILAGEAEAARSR